MNSVPALEFNISFHWICARRRKLWVWLEMSSLKAKVVKKKLYLCFRSVVWKLIWNGTTTTTASSYQIQKEIVLNYLMVIWIHQFPFYLWKTVIMKIAITLTVPFFPIKRCTKMSPPTAAFIIPSWTWLGRFQSKIAPTMGVTEPFRFIRRGMNTFQWKIVPTIGLM